MNNTLLQHGKCKGSVVLDIGQSVKLLAPSFQILGEGSIGNILVDVAYPPDGLITPVWECRGCQEQVPLDKLATDLQAECSICGKVKPIGDMSVTKNIPCVCSICVAELKAYLATGVSKNSLMKVYVETFGINRRTSYIPLVKVLSTPFPAR